jgi:hypothetical protein
MTLRDKDSFTKANKAAATENDGLAASPILAEGPRPVFRGYHVHVNASSVVN